MKTQNMKSAKVYTALAAGALFALSLTGCSKSDDPEPVPDPVIEVKLQSNATYGNILTDKDGRSLYWFANDNVTENHCTGGCEALWPVFNVDGLAAANIGEGLALEDFTTITTSTSKKQLAYKGRPLYYFAPAVGGVNTPEPAGATNGEGFGGIWFVAKTDYSIMLTSAQLIGHDGKSYLPDYTEGTGKTLYFTDGLGRTLYVFINDKFNVNKFTKPDFSNDAVWPIYETDQISVPSSLDKTAFGSIDVFGKKQLTYKGWPLYYFGQDAMVMGANKGISFPQPGIWPVPVKDIAPAPAE